MAASIRSRIPAAIKGPIRAALDVFDRSRRMRVLRRGVEQLRLELRKPDALRPQLLLDLCDAWGNRGFSADMMFLSEMANRVATHSGPFLECGSGVSTLIAGVIAGQQGKNIWSLEQDGAWYRQMDGMLKKFEVANVRLLHTPLRRYGDFAWFDLDGRAMPHEFSDVFCDGPAILEGEWPESVHSDWRVGLIPVFQARGIRFREVILDDADDPRCQRTCQIWNELGVATTVVATASGPFVVGRPVTVSGLGGPASPGASA